MISAFDIFKIGIGPSSSHTVGPMNAGKSFIDRLESSGLLTATSHIVVDLYGSLSLTGKGHATDVAIIMGLAGNSPQDVVIDEIPAFIELVTRSGRLPVASGAHIVDFPVAKNIIFHPEMLPRHENGMRITAWKGQEELQNLLLCRRRVYCRRRTLRPVARCRNTRTLRFPLSR